MTILTKPSNDKNSEKILLPLPLFSGQTTSAGHGQGDTYQRNLLEHQHSNGSNNADTESMVFNHLQFSCIKTILLCLISLVVMLTGMLCGYTLYHMYVPTPNKMHYRALCDIPYEPIGNNSAARIYPQNDGLGLNWFLLRLTGDDKLDSMSGDDSFFREEIEVDVSENDSYAKVDVPDFKDGRHGRFMHDFKENQSAIIDSTANRCFILPLDRETTLPPKNFMDLMNKMSSGYYNIDTERIKKHMRVITPPIKDLSDISERIANECYDMKVYKLENYVSGVYKRNVQSQSPNTYAEFLGKGIVEFRIMNLDDIDEYERQQQVK